MSAGDAGAPPTTATVFENLLALSLRVLLTGRRQSSVRGMYFVPREEGDVQEAGRAANECPRMRGVVPQKLRCWSVILVTATPRLSRSVSGICTATADCRFTCNLCIFGCLPVQGAGSNGAERQADSQLKECGC